MQQMGVEVLRVPVPWWREFDGRTAPECLGCEYNEKTTGWFRVYTPPKTNIEPENNGFQMDFPFPGTYFQVPC